MTNSRNSGPPFTIERYGSLGECIMAERDSLRGALTDLLEQCDDYFHGDSGFPLSDAMERARTALSGSSEPVVNPAVDEANFQLRRLNKMVDNLGKPAEPSEVYDKIGVLRPDGEFTTYEGCDGEPVYVRRTEKSGGGQ